MATTMPSNWHVPWEWEHRVCMCPDPKYGRWDDTDSFVGKVCTTCGKYFRWTLLKCLGCEKMYLGLFVHPQWCPHTSRCLDCCNAGYVSTCTHKICQWRKTREFRDYKYEEDKYPRAVPILADVLDYEISFDF